VFATFRGPACSVPPAGSRPSIACERGHGAANAANAGHRRQLWPPPAAPYHWRCALPAPARRANLESAPPALPQSENSDRFTTRDKHLAHLAVLVVDRCSRSPIGNTSDQFAARLCRLTCTSVMIR
jgi:hypothetical protein